VVSAVHRRPATEVTTQYIQDQVKAWRLLPGNVFILPETARPALADTLNVTILERGDPQATPWRRVDDLTLYGPDDRVFVFDDASSRILFGDGVTGRLPVPKDLDSVTVSYQVGGGTAGNLGGALAWDVLPARPIHAWNVVPAAGGLDAETLAAVRERAPEVLTAPDRAITATDFEELATQVPGTTVARAHASVGRHPLFPNRVVPGAITVFLVADVPRQPDGSPDYGTDAPFPPGPAPDLPTLDAVRTRLSQARLVASEVFVEAATYRPVTIDVAITGNPPDVQAMRDALVQALQAFFDPLVGGDDGSGWPFGGPVRPSSLLKVAQRAVGDAGTVDSAKIGLDDTADQPQGCTDVLIRDDELIVLEQVGVTINRPPAGREGLR
jgi:predicted phage baseplate assembly protein